MLILRLVIYLIPLAIFPVLIRFIFGKNITRGLGFPEFLSISILSGIGLFVFAEFILLQNYKFGGNLIAMAGALTLFFSFLLRIVAQSLFKYDLKHLIIPALLNKNSKRLLRQIFVIGVIWYLAVAIDLFKNPAFWWDEIIHWVPKAKTLIESGSFHDLNSFPITEYPRFWPIILANFMFIQDKLTQLVPLILYYIYWVFAITTSVRLIKIKKPENYISLGLVIVGAFVNIGWGAPYADLPFSVFYCTALIIMYLIIAKRVGWVNIVYIGVLLGTITEMRPEGFMYAISAIVIFCSISFFVNKLNALKSLGFLSLITLAFYIPWQVYISYYHVSNDILKVAKIGFRENWGQLNFTLQKSIQVFSFAWQQIGKVASPYFILAIFPFIGLRSFTKYKDLETIFSILVIGANFMIIFFIILFSPTLTGGFGGISFWLGANFTRFTNHYLPFVFFVSGVLLSKLQENTKKS